MNYGHHMHSGGNGGRKTYGRLRAWNRRATQWSYRYPWRYSAIYASGFTGPQLWVHYQYDFGPGAFFYAFVWLLLFVVVGSGTMARASRRDPERQSVPPTDLTLRGQMPDLREDGRRWRNGGP